MIPVHCLTVVIFVRFRKLLAKLREKHLYPASVDFQSVLEMQFLALILNQPVIILFICRIWMSGAKLCGCTSFYAIHAEPQLNTSLLNPLH